jgi:hypothetical protein
MVSTQGDMRTWYCISQIQKKIIIIINPLLLQHALRWNSLEESEEHQENLGR